MRMATEVRVRPYAGEMDIPEIVRVVNASLAADRIEEVWTVAALRSWLGHASPQFDAARDVVVVELDGRVVATGRLEWIDTRDGRYREYRLFGAVHPDDQGRGIGTVMLRDLEQRARTLAVGHDVDRDRLLAAFAPAGRSGETLLRDAGYEAARWYIDMMRPTLEAIDQPPLPDGLELRAVAPSQHEAIWRANREAFRDHWGGADESIEQLQRILGDPDTDPSLWLIAWDGDEIAGGVWNDIHPAENEAFGVRRGWLGSVFTRRPWRRRGLASALIGRSLALLQERGMTSAMLSVDDDNPPGAQALYEAAGFRVHDQFIALRKPLEAATT